MFFEFLQVLMRTLHILAAAAWIGGSIFYRYVLVPQNLEKEMSARISGSFQKLVRLSIGILVISGVYLVFDRLSLPTISPWYVGVLIAKIALSLLMFGLAFWLAGQRRYTARLQLNPGIRQVWLRKNVPTLVLWLGILVFALGATLVLLYEMSV